MQSIVALEDRATDVQHGLDGHHKDRIAASISLNTGRNAWILFKVDQMPSGIGANLLGRSDSVAACCNNAAVNPPQQNIDARVTPAI